MLDELAGLTSARGSGSALGKSTLPDACCAAALSAVQPVNGLGPEAVVVDERVYGPADAVLASTSAAMPAAARVGMRISPPSFEYARLYRSRKPRIASFASSPSIDSASQSRAWPTVSCQEISRHQLSCCFV